MAGRTLFSLSEAEKDWAQSPSPTLEQVKAVLLGAAVGDAFGVPFEFLSADAVAQYSLDVMHGADNAETVDSHWGNMIPTGAWSDDTSMAVATMESFIRTGGLRVRAEEDRVQRICTEVMEQFVAWWDKGEYCSIEQSFGLGQTVGAALMRFVSGVPALECGGTYLRDNGNGALMRIFPVLLHLLRNGETERVERNWCYETISVTSRITHGHAISQLSCLIFCEFLRFLLAGMTIEEAYLKTLRIPFQYWRNGDEQCQEAIEAHARILGDDFLSLRPDDFTPSGYVVDTLEIVLYSLLHTTSYRDAIARAVSFGGDTDTYAAIAGAAAGAVYGLESIPEQWLERLKRRDYLEDLARRFVDMNSTSEDYGKYRE